jgi:hypothetical protein
MAANAFLVEDGLYVGIKIDLIREHERVPANANGDQQYGNKYFIPE